MQVEFQIVGTVVYCDWSVIIDLPCIPRVGEWVDLNYMITDEQEQWIEDNTTDFCIDPRVQSVTLKKTKGGVFQYLVYLEDDNN